MLPDLHKRSDDDIITFIDIPKMLVIGKNNKPPGGATQSSRLKNFNNFFPQELQTLKPELKTNLMI